MRYLLAVAAAVVVTSACGAEAGGRERVEVVRLTAEEVLRVGSVDDPTTALTLFHALDVGPDGRIYTAHRRDHHVRVHAPDGRPEDIIGREGEGPGEFRSPGWLVVADGELLVWDWQLLRVSHFDLEGGFLRSERFQPPARTDPRFATARPQWMLADGSFVDEIPIQWSPDAPSVDASPIVHVGIDGTTLDTVGLRDLTRQHQLVDIGPAPQYDRQPFGDVPIWSVSPHAMELVIADRLVAPGTQRFRVTKLALSGDTLWSREYGFDPVPLTAADVDEYVQRRAGDYARVRGTEQGRAEAAVRRELHVPEHRPAATRVFVGKQGSVWIELADATAEASDWLHLSPDGGVVGIVMLPERFTPLHGEAGTLWGRDVDSLDVPYLVSFRVTPEEAN